MGQRRAGEGVERTRAMRRKSSCEKDDWLELVRDQRTFGEQNEAMGNPWLRASVRAVRVLAVCVHLEWSQRRVRCLVLFAGLTHGLDGLPFISSSLRTRFGMTRAAGRFWRRRGVKAGGCALGDDAVTQGRVRLVWFS